MSQAMLLQLVTDCLIRAVLAAPRVRQSQRALAVGALQAWWVGGRERTPSPCPKSGGHEDGAINRNSYKCKVHASMGYLTSECAATTSRYVGLC